jgi:hypothetical protein
MNTFLTFKNMGGMILMTIPSLEWSITLPFQTQWHNNHFNTIRSLNVVKRRCLLGLSNELDRGTNAPPKLVYLGPWTYLYIFPLTFQSILKYIIKGLKKKKKNPSSRSHPCKFEDYFTEDDMENNDTFFKILHSLPTNPSLLSWGLYGGMYTPSKTMGTGYCSGDSSMFISRFIQWPGYSKRELPWPGKSQFTYYRNDHFTWYAPTLSCIRTWNAANPAWTEAVINLIYKQQRYHKRNNKWPQRPPTKRHTLLGLTLQALIPDLTIPHMERVVVLAKEI